MLIQTCDLNSGQKAGGQPGVLRSPRPEGAACFKKPKQGLRTQLDSGTLVLTCRSPGLSLSSAEKHYVHGLSTVSQEQSSPCRNTLLQRSKVPRGSGKTLVRWFKKSWLLVHFPTSYVISKRKKHYKELPWLLIPVWVLSTLALWACYFEPRRWREHRKGGRDSKWHWWRPLLGSEDPAKPLSFSINISHEQAKENFPKVSSYK